MSVTCPDCPLSLEVVARESALLGQPESVVVALSFRGAPEALPVLADLRFQVSGPARLTRIGMAPSLMNAGKTLVADPDSGLPYRRLGDGTWQLMITPGASSPIEPGPWLFLRYELDPPDRPEAAVPFVIALVPREETFAPQAADAALWGTALGKPLVVWAQPVHRGDR